MTDARREHVTRLLEELSTGNAKPAAELLPLVYDELRKLARHRIAQERAGHTLQATALVHEVYLRLVGNEDPGWANRAHFFKAAAEAMRRVLIDHARKKGRLKRGGERKRVAISVADLAATDDADLVIDLDDAIERLGEMDPELADLVKLRFYAGLSIEDTAQAQGISASTVKREWAVARAWLYNQLGCAGDSGDDGDPGSGHPAH